MAWIFFDRRTKNRQSGVNLAMKSIPSILTALILLLALPLAASNAPGWEKIGEKKASRKLDRDEISISKDNDQFRAIQFRANRSDVNIARCAIHFKNGKVKTVKMGQNIKAGEASKTIKFGLMGGPKAVKKVVVWYDTMDDADQKAVVEVWGKR
jgi:ribosomal protein L18E